MTRIIDFALSKAKTTLMIAFMIIIAGSYARQEISIAASPNVQLPHAVLGGVGAFARNVAVLDLSHARISALVSMASRLQTE